MSFEFSVPVATPLRGAKTWRIYDLVVITTKGRVRVCLSFFNQMLLLTITQNGHVENVVLNILAHMYILIIDLIVLIVIMHLYFPLLLKYSL